MVQPLVGTRFKLQAGKWEAGLEEGVLDDVFGFS